MISRALAPGQVHLWWIGLDEELCAAEMGRLGKSLSVEERERAGRFRVPELRARALVVRAALRDILALYLGEPPEGLRLIQDISGKPALEEPKRLQFSLSHSGALALLAVSLMRVGVDLEMERALPYRELLLRRFFSAEERRLAGSASEATEAAGLFLMLWTRREAAAKALGLSLSVFFAQYCLPALPFSEDGFPIELQGTVWRLRDLRPASRCAGALCAEGAQADLSYRRWRPESPETAPPAG